MKVKKSVLGLLAAGSLAFFSGRVEAASPKAAAASELTGLEAGLSSQQIEADWLRSDSLREKLVLGNATPETDAAGGCDGVKDGKWGFHTQCEENPWWQVDLGKPMPIDRVVVYNRCDGTAVRTAKIRILLSADGRSFKEVYQHNGTIFYGQSDQKPMTAELKGAAGRYVRLQIPGRDYLHLDEVEVHAGGKPENVALRKPATQSSISDWSVAHATETARTYPTARIVERGLKLAENLRQAGVKVAESVAELKKVSEELPKLAADASDEVKRALYFRAHWAVRRMALDNPLLNFDKILFVKRAPAVFPHMSDQHYGWWSRPGGGIYVLEGFKGGAPRLTCLTSDMPVGSFTGPDISFDGKKLLFAYCKYHPGLADQKDKTDKFHMPEDGYHQVFEMNIDGSHRHQLTHGKYDSFDARYLPSGEIVFLSTRKGVSIQCTQFYSATTQLQDQPDSYVRCGGDNYRPVAVYTLHQMDATGGHIRPLSAFEGFEWTPSVANDGRILYARWDYVDRFNGPFVSLWSAHQDGTAAQLLYGNFTTKPQGKFEPRSIPNSNKVIFTAIAHHSITGGSLCLLDRTKGTELETPIKRLTPEVCFPETEGWPSHYYANPFPLSEDFYLVGWADAKLPPHCRVDGSPGNPPNAMGVYLYDAFGNLELLHRDPAISSMYPMPVLPRTKPMTQPALANWTGAQEGQFLIQDIYQGLDGVPRGAVKQLRIVGMPPKPQPQMNAPNLGINHEEPGKFVLGTVPVEPDGSAHFPLPSGIPVMFQVLDDHGLAIQTMRSLTYTMPGQTVACVGCHEHRDSAPTANRLSTAATRLPSKITPGPDGSWPLRYDRLIQPVLDKNCISCHKPGGSDPAAAKLDLTAPKSYTSLLEFGNKDLHNLSKERDRSVPGQCVAINSKLWKVIADANGHKGVKLEKESLDRFAVWMDLYAHRQGSYSEAQEKELEQLRTQLAGMMKK